MAGAKASLAALAEGAVAGLVGTAARTPMGP